MIVTPQIAVRIDHNAHTTTADKYLITELRQRAMAVMTRDLNDSEYVASALL
jgi:hypothetical protein